MQMPKLLFALTPATLAKRLSVVTLLAICAACLGGCGSSSNNLGSAASASSFASAQAAAGGAALTAAADNLTSEATPGNGAYRIGPLDVLDVTVFKVPDLAKIVQVADDGTINYPLVGEVRVAGQTAHELERQLTAKLSGKYLRSPQVTVLIKEYNSQRVTLIGSVKSTGVYALKGETSLMQVLAMAGDIDTNVASGNVVIFRKHDGKRYAARFDADAIREGKAADPGLEPGDVIVVDTSSTKVALQNVMKVLPLVGMGAMFVPLL